MTDEYANRTFSRMSATGFHRRAKLFELNFSVRITYI